MILIFKKYIGLSLLAVLSFSVSASASPFVIDLTRTVDPLLPGGPTNLVTGFAVEPGSSLTIDVTGSTTADGTGELNGNSGGIGVLTDAGNTTETVIGVEDTITITFNFDGELLEFLTINIGPVTLAGPGGPIAFNDAPDGLTGTIPSGSPFSFSAGESIVFGVDSSISALSSLTVTPTPTTATILALAGLALLRRRAR